MITIKEICDKAIPFLQSKGAEYAALFGSVARGEAKPDSDIDILVRFKEDVSLSLLDHIGIAQDLEDILGQKVDLITEHTLKKDVAPFVKQDLTVLFGEGKRPDLSSSAAFYLSGL